ncbi:MAG: ABC transporter ATP-binding protein [Chlamydiia bacterium]|nr:ABC transporter ATP-binding protein [Chlamydiia bacterium]
MDIQTSHLNQPDANPHTDSSAPVISVRNLRKVYPSKPPFVAVHDLSLDLMPGEILGLLGPNGSGKTTTIQMLLGTLSPTSGSVSYFGLNFDENRSEVLGSVSFASTYSSLPWNLTIAENLEVYGYFYGMSPSQSREKSVPLLKRFGIYDKCDKRISSLSAGQITRVMLVKAFFVEPRVVLLDEPTASLDPDIANDICAFLLEYRERTGISMLFTSHKMDEVMEVCNRVIFLKEGRIVADGAPGDLAKSLSGYRVRLVIVDGLRRTLAIAEQMELIATQDHRTVEVVMNEEAIPAFLNALSEAKVSYASIKIEEPSLEEYFLQMARKQ